MELSFFPLTLEAVDQSAAEALCVFVGEDERPLAGLAGLADWRLSGGLSRLLRSGLLKGVQGEALLTPARRLPFRKLFLFGIGPQQQGEEELSACVAEALRKLASARVEDAALQLPARLSPEAGIRVLLDAEQAPVRALVFGPDPAALVRALSQAARSRGTSAPPERRVVKVPGPPKATLPPRPAPPPRQPPLEIPKATPLPFAPSNASAPPEKPSAATPPPAPGPATPAPPPGSAVAPPGSASPSPGAEADGPRPMPYRPQRYIPPPPKDKKKP
jgi:hypothetical protein